MSLPNAVPTVPWAVYASDTRQVVADESTTNRTPRAIPHRPLHHQLSRTNSIPTSPFMPGHTCNTDQSQTYRILPIIAGILIPLSVLLSIPSLTSQWSVRTDGNETLETRPNSLHHIVTMSLGMACGVLANICLVLRFAERNIKMMTLICIFLLLMNGSCLSSGSRLLFLLTDINYRTYKHNCTHCLRGDSSPYRGTRLRTVILDVLLLNGDFNGDQRHANHRLLSYRKFFPVR